MALNISTIGDNPMQPTASSQTYLPDQLIAGNLHLVSQPIVISAGVLARGTVLGQLSSYSVRGAAGTNAGNGTIGSFIAGTGAMVGGYTITAISPTAWTVTNPEGVAMPNAANGVAYNQQGLGFTITAGGTAFVAGDSFTVNASDSVGNFIACVKTASDGSQTPVAILADSVDASLGPVKTGAYLMGEFNINAVIFDPSWTPELLTTAMRPWAIYLKASVSAQDAGITVTNFA